VAGPLAVDGVCVETTGDSKLERALIVTSRLRSFGRRRERVGIPGYESELEPHVIDKMAQTMLHDDAVRASLPPAFVPSALPKSSCCRLWSPMPRSGHARGAFGRWRARTLIQSSIPRRNFPYSAASNSSNPKAARSSCRPRRKLGQRLRRRASRCIAMKSAPRPTGSTGCSRPTPQPLGGRTAAVPACRHDGEQGRRAFPVKQDEAHDAGLPLSFAEPLLLLGLLTLPALWWLLRVMPPRPRRIEFPRQSCCSTSRQRKRPVAHAVVADALRLTRLRW